MWKKSIFWELPYWQVLEVCSAIDVMHLTKNLCVNLLGFMGVYGKPKDTLEAQQDKWCLKEWDNLHPKKTDDGHHYLSPASYTLSKEEKESMFECLASIKVPSGFSSNIKGIINVPEKKFLNLKSHDCHVLLPSSRCSKKGGPEKAGISKDSAKIGLRPLSHQVIWGGAEKRLEQGKVLHNSDNNRNNQSPLLSFVMNMVQT